jgi:hypothetical protein
MKRRIVLVAIGLAGCKGNPSAPAPTASSAQETETSSAVSRSDHDAASAPDAWIISAHGVGPITATTEPTVEAIQRLVPTLQVEGEQHEGEDFSYLAISLQQDGAVQAEIIVDEGTLFKVEVRGPLFATAQGLRVTSTVAELASAMPELSCRYETYDPDLDAQRVDRLLFCTTAEAPSISYSIDLTGFRGGEGPIAPEMIAERSIDQIVWLAPSPAP